MSSHLTDEARWAEALTSRLRLVQASFADEGPEVRRGYLSEELERAISTVPQASRAGYLKELALRFPLPVSAQAPAAAAPGSGTAASAPGQDLGALDLAAELRLRFPELPEEEKAAVRRELAGIMGGGGGDADVAPELVAEFWKRLGRPATAEPPSRARELKAFAVLVEAFLRLDQPAWMVWKHVNPKSMFQREAELARLLGPYLEGDGEVSTEQIRVLVEKSRKLISGFVSAANGAARHVAREHTEVFTPNASRRRPGWRSGLSKASRPPAGRSTRNSSGTARRRSGWTPWFRKASPRPSRRI